MQDDGYDMAANADPSEGRNLGRLYAVSGGCVNGEALVVAKSPSAAKYAAYIEANLTWSFMEFCDGLRVRLAHSQRFKVATTDGYAINFNIT